MPENSRQATLELQLRQSDTWLPSASCPRMHGTVQPVHRWCSPPTSTHRHTTLSLNHCSCSRDNNSTFVRLSICPLVSLSAAKLQNCRWFWMKLSGTIKYSSLSAVTHAPFHASVLRPASQVGPMHEDNKVGDWKFPGWGANLVSPVYAHIVWLRTTKCGTTSTQLGKKHDQLQSTSKWAQSSY